MDGRTSVPDETIRPYAAICHLVPEFSGDRASTQGPLSDLSRRLLTAAHNLYMLRSGRTGRTVPWRYRVTPGRNGVGALRSDRKPAMHLYASATLYGDGAIRCPIRASSKRPPFAAFRAYSVSPALSTSRLRQVRSHRFLPYRWLSLRQVLRNMWRPPSARSFSPHSLYYRVDTRLGHDGSPIWVRRDRAGQVDAIGIHVSGPPGIARTYVSAGLRRPAQPIAACGSRAS